MRGSARRDGGRCGSRIWRRCGRASSNVCAADGAGLRENGADDVVVVVGGTIPEDDADELRSLGVAEVFSPGAPMAGIVDFIRGRVPV